MTCDTVFLVGGPNDGEWRQLEIGCFGFPVAIRPVRGYVPDEPVAVGYTYGAYRRPTLFANTMTWDGPE